MTEDQLVTFRLFIRKLDNKNDRTYTKYWDENKNHLIEDGLDK